MSILNSLKYDQWYQKLSASARKKTWKYKKDVLMRRYNKKFHNLLVIALVIIRRTYKAHRTDRGAENHPTGPKLPDFTLHYLFWNDLI